MKIYDIIKKIFPVYCRDIYYRNEDGLNFKIFIFETIMKSSLDLTLFRLYLENNESIVALKYSSISGEVHLYKEVVGENYMSGLRDMKKRILVNEKYSYFKYDKFGNISYLNKNILELEGSCSIYREKSDEIAFIEYLERLCGMNNAKFEIIKTSKINKKNCIFYEGIKEMGYDVLKVVKGKSLLNNNNIYIPYNYIYYIDIDSEFYHFNGSSNGVAVGKNIDDATVRGALEVIERSDFMMFWFENTEAVELIIDKSISKLRALIDFEELHNYRVRFFYLNSKRECNEIKTVWCFAESTSLSNKIYSMSGLASDFSLQEAIKKSFFEMKRTLDIWNNKEMLSASHKGESDKNVLFNILLYFSSYDRKKNFDKMLVNIPKKNINEYDICSKYSNNEKKEIILFTVSKYFEDIIVVDMSNSIIEDLSLKCVKIIIKGTRDIVFSKMRNKYGFDYQPIA